MTTDGKRAVSGSEDQTLRVRDLREGTCLVTEFFAAGLAWFQLRRDFNTSELKNLRVRVDNRGHLGGKSSNPFPIILRDLGLTLMGHYAVLAGLPKSDPGEGRP
jgi:hypothetical protein